MSTELRYTVVSRTTNKAKMLFKPFSVDLTGLASVATHEVKRYAIAFREHFSPYLRICFLASKQDTPRSIELFVDDTRLVGDVEVIRSDNGSELEEGGLSSILDPPWIEREYIPPGVSKVNSVEERVVRC